MHRVSKRSWACALLALSLLACGGASSAADEHDGGSSAHDGGARSDAGDADDESDARPIPVPVEGWEDLPSVSADLNRYLEAFCGRSVGCGDESLANCRSSLVSYYCAPVYATLELPDLDACVAALGSVACDDRFPTACTPARRARFEARGYGTVRSEGEACDGLVAMCENDLFCTGSDASCGTCVRTLAQGEPCTDTLQCSGGTYCGKAGKCTPYLADGSACDEQVDVCDRGVCVDGRCAKPPALSPLGAACEDDQSCDLHAFCVNGTCQEPPACGAGKVGDPCRVDDGCTSELACDPYTRRCVDRRADEGVTCDPSAAEWPCSFFTYCGESSACQARGENGAACAFANQPTGVCMSNWCNGQGECGPKPSVCDD